MCIRDSFMGLVPDSMEKIRMYGVELDSISGRIAQQLYQKNKIAVQGFETMQFPDSFFDCVVGNVPFGNYKVPDKRYEMCIRDSLWNLDSHEHEQAILDHLADTYGLLQTDSMNTALMELAQQLTADNLDEAMDGLAYEVADTFLEELDEDNIRVRFRELMTNSIFYTLSRRCGQEPMNVLDDDDFIRIVDFNKLPVLSFLGNAVSEQCEAVLFDIGREMRKIYKKEITQQLEKSVDSLYNTNTDFSTLKRKTKETTTKGGQENGVDVLPQGRLSCLLYTSRCV